MVTKIRICFVILVAALVFLPCPARAQGPTASVAKTTQGKQRRGLWDFATGRINSTDKDYGECITEARQLTLDETFGRGLFWSNILSLAIASCLLVIVIHQSRVKVRRELITANVLTQYQNALTQADAQIAEATVKNRALMQALIAPAGSELESIKVDDSKAQNARAKSRKNAVEEPATSIAAESQATHSTTVGDALDAIPNAQIQPLKSRTPEPPSNAWTSKTNSATALFASDVDLIAKVNSLQQQLNTAQEREKQLRRQLNTSELRFQKEQQKIQTIKNQ